jgi:putative transposase
LGLSDRSDFNFFCFINTSGMDVLQRLVEFTQYASQDFRDVLTEYGMTASMSRRGNCWDNACSETLFGSLKVERLHGQRFVTRRQAKDETIAWLLWYNQTRLHSTLAYVSPVRFEQDWIAAQAKQANS